MLRPLTVSYVHCLVLKLILRHACSILLGFACDCPASASGRLVFPPPPIFFSLHTHSYSSSSFRRHCRARAPPHTANPSSDGLITTTIRCRLSSHFVGDLITVNALLHPPSDSMSQACPSSFNLPTRCRGLVPLRSTPSPFSYPSNPAFEISYVSVIWWD